MLAGEVVIVPQEVQKMGTLLMQTREAVSQISSVGYANDQKWGFFEGLTRSNGHTGLPNW